MYCSTNIKYASLFSGIGGFDLAARWMQWEIVFQVENDAFCLKVLEKNFPDSARYEDIKDFHGTDFTGQIDILTGGFPCQPFSISGRRKASADSRHLWPEMLRVISEVKPKVVVAENVYGIITAEKGLVFQGITADLENAGYEASSYIIPACAVGAPHRRDRVWIVAHSIDNEAERLREYCRKILPVSETEGPDLLYASGTAADPDSINADTAGFCSGILSLEKQAAVFTDFSRFPSESPVCRADDGIPDRLDRLRALGNALVPQVAYRVFQSIEYAWREMQCG